MSSNTRANDLKLLKQFVEIESFSYDLDGIMAMAKKLEEVFAPYANEISYFTSDDQPCHLKMTFGKGTKQILLLTHLDTVYPKHTINSMPWHEQESRVYGPGVLDIKASYVMIYKLIKNIQNKLASSNVKIVWLNTGDEEIGSPDGKEIVIGEAQKSEAVLVLEPALGKGALKTARKGGGKYTITVRGRSAHAGVDPENGLNAIVELAKLIGLVSSQEDKEKGTTITVGTISGGTLFNVVPDLAKAEIDIRVKTMEEKARIEAFFQRITPFTEGIKFEIEGGIYRPPFIRNEGTAWLYSIAKKCAEKLNIPISEAETGGGSDGNFAATTGVPVLDGLGAIGEGAHSPNEYVLIESIEERARMLIGIIRELIGQVEK